MKNDVVYGGRIRRGDLTDAAFGLRVARTPRGYDIFTPDGSAQGYLAATDLTEDEAKDVLGQLKVRDIDGMNPQRLLKTMMPSGKEYDFTVKSSRIGLARVLNKASDES
jgi:hypothetical protein